MKTLASTLAILGAIVGTACASTSSLDASDDGRSEAATTSGAEATGTITTSGGASGPLGSSGHGGASATASSGTGASSSATTTTGAGGAPLACDSGFAFGGDPITHDPVTVTYTNATGFVNVDLHVTGPGAPHAQWGGVAGSGPYTWSYAVSGFASGVLTLEFVKDEVGASSGAHVASCQVNAVVGSEGGMGGDASTGTGLADCASLAAANGWAGGQFTCDDGSHGWCAGSGTPTSDCAACCGPSCGVLATYYASSASCDDGSNHVCNGSGIATWDCAGGCCGAGIPSSQPPTGTGFGYPVGDKSTSPAGGWELWQVLGDYWDEYGGAHLAEDVGTSGAAYQPVYSVADGVVLVAAPNSSTYVNVALIQHVLGDGTTVCSFYGHLATLSVSPGQPVSRGDVIATVLDQGTNSHVHYFIAPKDLCDYIASVNGGGACGYDGSTGVPGLGHADLADEPASYAPSGTNAGCGLSGYTILAPHTFIDAHHF